MIKIDFDDDPKYVLDKQIAIKKINDKIKREQNKIVQQVLNKFTLNEIQIKIINCLKNDNLRELEKILIDNNKIDNGNVSYSSPNFNLIFDKNNRYAKFYKKGDAYNLAYFLYLYDKNKKFEEFANNVKSNYKYLILRNSSSCKFKLRRFYLKKYIVFDKFYHQFLGYFSNNKSEYYTKKYNLYHIKDIKIFDDNYNIIENFKQYKKNLNIYLRKNKADDYFRCYFRNINKILYIYFIYKKMN